ncbi:MAG: hypothetical protein QOJ65_1412 [Fimbriimonadaceae bacterium]|nr:hypothetical protein [Fimbriimonadaceae bacterium]
MRLPLRFSWPLALAVLAWAFNYVALKLLYEQMTPSQVAFLRYVVMYAVLVVLCLITGQSLKLPKEDRWRILYFGFASMGVYLFFFLEAMRWSQPAEGAILLNISPILTMLLAAALKQERLRAAALGGAAIAFTGVVLVMIPALGHGEHRVMGYVLMIVSALVWAYCIVLMKPLLGKYSPLRLMTLSMPGGFPIMFGYWIVRDHGRVPLGQITPMGWLFFAHVALLSGVMGFLLFYRGVHEIGPAGAALWMYFVPPLTALCQWAFMHVGLEPVQIAGLVVVIVGVATAQRFRGQPGTPVAPPEPA